MRKLCVSKNSHTSKFSQFTISDCNWTRTQNHLVIKRTLNHLAKLAKWLSCVLSTYLYGAFDCMFLPCHVRVLSCSHLTFIFCACFEQGVPWHSSNYGVWIHSETHVWHDKNIQLNLRYVWSAQQKMTLWNFVVSKFWQNEIDSNLLDTRHKTYIQCT